MRVERVRAHVCSELQDEGGRRHETALAVNGCGRFAPTSCQAGGWGARRAFDVGPSAFDHLLVGTHDRYVETGPQLVWRPMPTRPGPGLAKSRDVVSAAAERTGGVFGVWVDDTWAALTREPEGRTGE